jgi:hypothetical protein
LPHSTAVLVAPRRGSGNGHRTDFLGSGCRDSAFGTYRMASCFLCSVPGTAEALFTVYCQVRAPELHRSKPIGSPSALPFRGRFQVTSGLDQTACRYLFTFYSTALAVQFRPIPVRRNFCAWECKLTPADCTCQEGNTIGCIPSNDGLGAGMGTAFPHCLSSF